MRSDHRTGVRTEIPSTVNGNSVTFEAPYFATYAIIDIAQASVKYVTNRRCDQYGHTAGFYIKRAPEAKLQTL